MIGCIHFLLTYLREIVLLSLQLHNSPVLLAFVSFGMNFLHAKIAYHMPCIKVKNFKLYGIFVSQAVSFKTSSHSNIFPLCFTFYTTSLLAEHSSSLETAELSVSCLLAIETHSLQHGQSSKLNNKARD